MHVKASLINAVTSFVVLSRAFLVPGDLPDGHYSVALYADGNASDPVQVSALGKRSMANLETPVLPYPQIGCNGYSVSGDDYSVSRSGLNNWCEAGNKLAPSSAVFVTYRSAIAYICNYGGPNPCNSREFDEANALMDVACSGSSAGWVLIN